MAYKTQPTERYFRRPIIGENRSEFRFDTSSIPGFKSINRVGGPEVKLLNISIYGALIESHERFSLGSNISLQLVTGTAVHIIKGKIIHYSSFNGKEPIYQYGIAFSEDFKIIS